ncbi:hypothetical protein C0995_008639 [Termitomyces sp. Mi166|nr:hypothetical protein C0995_008639 [Termitomyces sp. Mi166\
MQPVNKALLQCLERAGQPVPATAAFLQDSLAIVVIEGLLDQIKMMKRQRITALEHIERTGKRKAPAYKEPVVEPKWARALVRRPQEFMQAPVPTVVQPPPPHEPDILAVVENPLAELLLEPCDEIMANAPAMQQGQRVEVLYAPVMGSQAGPSSQGEARLAPEIPALKAQPVAVKSHGLSASLHAPNVLGPTKHRQGQKPPLDLSKLDVMDFPDNVPAQAGPAQLLFMHTVLIPAPPPQFLVVVLTTDPRTPDQYDGLVATQQKTAAMSKGKGKAVATILSEDKQESEEGKLAAQRFQCMQWNKKLAMMKANVAKAEAAQQHWAINDFSDHIPNGLGVKVWGPLDVEQLNSCFRGALGDCMYYSPYSNTVHVGADANWAAAFKFNSHQQAKVPATIVYKYAPHGLLHTPYELEWLYKYYANEHVPHHDRIVMYMLISELLQFVQRLNDNLHDRTMQVILSDPVYWDLKNPIRGPEDMDLVERRHIPMRFLRIKEDGTLVLHVMHAPDPSHPFDLEQVAQYMLIFG